MNINFLNRKILFAFDNLSLFYWNLFLISKIDINLIENFGWKSDDWLHFVKNGFNFIHFLHKFRSISNEKLIFYKSLDQFKGEPKIN